jgi:DNA modification methylase
MNTGRNFIGYEKEKKYFDISQERIFSAQKEVKKELICQ